MDTPTGPNGLIHLTPGGSGGPLSLSLSLSLCLCLSLSHSVSRDNTRDQQINETRERERQRERERARERDSERARERETARETARERDSERDSEREREREREAPRRGSVGSSQTEECLGASDHRIPAARKTFWVTGHQNLSGPAGEGRRGQDLQITIHYLVVNYLLSSG